MLNEHQEKFFIRIGAGALLIWKAIKIAFLSCFKIYKNKNYERETALNIACQIDSVFFVRLFLMIGAKTNYTMFGVPSMLVTCVQERSFNVLNFFKKHKYHFESDEFTLAFVFIKMSNDIDMSKFLEDMKNA